MDNGRLMVQVGRRRCGCIMAVAVPREGHEKQLGKELQLWAETGLRVELIPANEVVLFGECPHVPRQLGLPLLSGELPGEGETIAGAVAGLWELGAQASVTLAGGAEPAPPYDPFADGESRS